MIDKLREMMLEHAAESASPDFEIHHLLATEKHAREIAIKRGLDTELASLIAILHDCGRTRMHTLGKEHAFEGAKEAIRLISSMGANEKTQFVVFTAIQNHNKKNKVQDEYSEMIKDADCMSHSSELIDFEDKPFETVRAKGAFHNLFRPLVNMNLDRGEVLRNEIDSLKLILVKIANGEVDEKTVHSARIAIRRSRSLLWLVESEIPQDTIELLHELDISLKNVFRTLENARQIYVLHRCFPESEKIKSRLETTYEKLPRAIRNHFTDEVLIESTWIAKKIFAEHVPDEKHEIKRIKKIGKSSMKAKDFDSIHDLRISAKRLRYLRELGVIGFEDVFMDVLLDAQSVFGRYRDDRLNRKLLKKFDKDMLRSVKKRVRKKELSVMVFRMKYYFAKGR